MTIFVTAIFALTYLGMALGRFPGLKVDRSGIAMIAAVVLVAAGAAVPLIRHPPGAVRLQAGGAGDDGAIPLAPLPALAVGLGLRHACGRRIVARIIIRVVRVVIGVVGWVIIGVVRVVPTPATPAKATEEETVMKAMVMEAAVKAVMKAAVKATMKPAVKAAVKTAAMKAPAMKAPAMKATAHGMGRAGGG